MMDLLTQRNLLAQADRDVAEGEEMVAQQRARIEHLDARAIDTHPSEALLVKAEKFVALLREIRAEMLETVVELEASAHRH